MDAAGGAEPLPPAQAEPPSVPSNTTAPAALTLSTFDGPLHFSIPPPRSMPPYQRDAAQDRQPDSDDGSGSDNDDDGDGDDNDESEDEEPRWYHIEEDPDIPCKDELDYIESKEEHSALDHEYFEKKTFLDLNDPELTPIESGRIDWLVERFNGTKENPNRERIMRSPTVRIAGLDWRIKFYPKGDKSDYLSLYIECVSMMSPDFEESEDFQDPPFPFLKNATPLRKRRSVAVQFGVVMYNPAEPRVYEFQSEASQFSKKSTNFGWKYFTRSARYDFHTRLHAQRQAILRDDKLAFKAFIRVVNDPTGCLWTGDLSADQMTSIIGLRPFSRSLQFVPAVVPLLHFAPFREFVQNLVPDTNSAEWLQHLLLKMYTRKRSSTYRDRSSSKERDVMEMLWTLSRSVQNEYHDSSISARFIELVGTYHAEKGAACGSSRLNTHSYPSIQVAIDNHAKAIAQPALLTLELKRHEHDKKSRMWKKVKNNVTIDEQITLAGTDYTLFAFITHCDNLRSNRYNSYVRPKGPGNGWYSYQNGTVMRLTEKQARDKHSGTDSSSTRSTRRGYDSPLSELHDPSNETACAVMYVRKDVAAETFNSPAVEDWTSPDLSQQDLEKISAHGNSQPPKGDVLDPDNGAPESKEDAVKAAMPAASGPILMDGDDVVMKDDDDDSIFSIEEQETSPQDEDRDVGTLDWLGREYYNGEWQDNKFHGGGHLIASNGDEYLGQFQKGLSHGTGRMIYSKTGDVYEGHFKDGVRHGQGKYTELESGNVYDGGWKDDQRHGQFVLRGTVTEEDKSLCRICYCKDIDTAFYDCGHIVACADCASQQDECGICRKRVIARLTLKGAKVIRS